MPFGYLSPPALILPRPRYTPWGEDDLDREINLNPDHPVAAQEPYDGNIPAPGMLLEELLGPLFVRSLGSMSLKTWDVSEPCPACDEFVVPWVDVLGLPGAFWPIHKDRLGLPCRLSDTPHAN